jgi:hypothetical protein
MEICSAWDALISNLLCQHLEITFYLIGNQQTHTALVQLSGCQAEFQYFHLEAFWIITVSRHHAQKQQGHRSNASLRLN